MKDNLDYLNEAADLIQGGNAYKLSKKINADKVRVKSIKSKGRKFSKHETEK